MEARHCDLALLSDQFLDTSTGALDLATQILKLNIELEFLVRQLNDAPHIEHLYLEANQLTDQDAVQLAKLSHIKTLILTKNNFTAVGVKLLASNTKFITLNLSEIISVLRAHKHLLKIIV